jgi:putative transposase
MVQTLRECRGLYNTLLAERRDTYEQTGDGVSWYAQKRRLPELKETNPALRGVHSQVLQDVALRLDLAFKAFYPAREGGREAGLSSLQRCESLRQFHVSAEWLQGGRR